jgi:hypothetical protein
VELKHCLGWLGVGTLMFLHKLHVALQILQNVNPEQPLKVIIYANIVCSLSLRVICIYIAHECSTRNRSFQKHTLHLRANLQFLYRLRND